MATVRTQVDDTGYTEIATGTDALVQNTSSRRMRVIFAGSTPSVDDANFHILMPSKALQQINGQPVGNIYVRMSDPDTTGFVTVS